MALFQRLGCPCAGRLHAGRVHVDYIPSQVVTEFFRELSREKNLVFFANHENVRGAATEPTFFPREEWFRLLTVERRSVSGA
jgi:hypothetical protein